MGSETPAEGAAAPLVDPLGSFAPYAVSESNAAQARALFDGAGVPSASARDLARKKYTLVDAARVYGPAADAMHAYGPAALTKRPPSQPSPLRRLSRRSSRRESSLPRVAAVTRQRSDPGRSSRRTANTASDAGTLPPGFGDRFRQDIVHRPGPPVAAKLDPLFERIAAAEEHRALPTEKLGVSEGAPAQQRIAAGDLLGSEFMRRFFLSNATLADAQSLVRRLQTLLRLLDKEATGFVTWGHFADVIVSVAPPQLLRSNVLAFLDAQADSPNSLIDYAEFVITGKVMILDEFW